MGEVDNHIRFNTDLELEAIPQLKSPHYEGEITYLIRNLLKVGSEHADERDDWLI